MEELLQEFCDSRGLSLRIDRENGVLREVKLIGLTSRNGRRYLPTALASAINLYEGAKVNVNHPKGNPLAVRDYQDRLGVVRNVVVKPDAGLFGDLHFNPKHVLAEQLLWDAEHSPENVGFSHNVQARTTRQGEQTVVEAILHVQSVDLVADPATTHGLFEHDSNTNHAATTLSLAQLTLADLQTARPDLAQQLTLSLTEEVQALKAELERQRMATRPLSREQVPLEPLVESIDTLSFVRAIT